MRFNARPFPGSGSVKSGEAAQPAEPRRREIPETPTEKPMPRATPAVPRVAPRAKKPELPEPSLLHNPVPSWLQPFTMPSNRSTRFTRTPDYLLRPREEPQPTPAEPAPQWTPEPGAQPPGAAGASPDSAADSAAAQMDPPAFEEPALDGSAFDPPASDTAQPPSVRRIAGLIRLDWDQPPAVEQDPIGPEPTAPAAPPASDPPAFGSGFETPFATSFETSFPWPIHAAASIAVAQPAAIAVPIVVTPVVAPAPVAAPARATQPMAAPAAPVPAAPVPAASVPAPRPVAGPAPARPAAVAPPAASVLPPEPPAPMLRARTGEYELPPLELLAEPINTEPDFELSADFLDSNSVKLQQVLHDFGVRGEIIDANPGPVVTLYELEPAPGTKSSRVIGLSADISRSMSAVSARVAVVEGRNVIGIELPNQKREMVWLRELLSSHDFEIAKAKLGIALGKTIGGEPVIVDLARMPHLLVAGTTGSGKSVAINTMILSLLYRHSPENCRLIMIDPKMLELSVYEGIPHLLTPVVTDPKKAVIALKWAVREMEERYKKMSRLGVRNIDGYNARVSEASARGETITRIVQTGFDKETGRAVEEEETMDLSPLPYIVVIVDEMADLMMVAGKDIEGAIQRLAQMARAAGIHLIMATQRPSVDVITGTIKANFPTRISFQVTSKIDSRTILGEQGAEQLLGQGDMLYMAGGGRISRVHGPFVSDQEVERVVEHLKAQGRPDYVDAVTAGDEERAPEEGEDGAVFDKGSFGEEGGDLYDQAVAVVMRDRKASTSYIQRRLQIGYNRAASLMERMENEGLVGPANHAGKRDILSDGRGGGH